MILLNPIWLFALAALSIPVAIHLWNIRQGKTLKVGSIALISESSQKRSRSFKLNDILLLLLRCLLLLLLAFVLAGPLWQKYLDSNTIKGWVLIPKEDLKESYQKFKPKIDSLNKAGYEFHYFNKGFEKAEFNKVVNDTTKVKSNPIASYWTLIQHLDGQIPSALPVYLFTPNHITHFNGAKPQVSLTLHWQTYTPADSTSTWLQSTWLGNNNDIQVVQGNSKPGGTSFTNYTIQSGNPHNSPFTVNTENGRLTVSLKNGSSVAVDTSTWRFAIYADKGTADAGYLKAALQSVIQFTKHKAVINQYTDEAQILSHQNWIFWLSKKPIRNQLVRKTDNLFNYVTWGVNETNTWINAGSEFLPLQKVAIYKLTFDEFNGAGEPLWEDSYGNFILSLSRYGDFKVYHFYSHFDPVWSDLVWSNDFPKMMLKLIVNQPPYNAKYDRRVMDAQQLVPAENTDVNTSKGKMMERTNLTKYCWLLLVLAFMAERWMAHKKTSKQVLQNG